MKKLYYIANIRMPTEKAHGIQIMEMCHAFASLGLEVELIVPNRKTDITEDSFTYYDVEKNFNIRKVWCLDMVRFGRIGFWIESITFAKRVAGFSLFHKGVFYTREEIVAFYLGILGKNPVWEAHRGQANLFVHGIILLKQKIVVITEALKDLYVNLGAKADKLFTAPDGADIDRFDLPISKSDAREQLNLPRDKRIVLYKGSLIPWKGAGTLAEAAKLVTTRNVQFVFIGGDPKDVEAMRKKYEDLPQVSILGNRPRKETPIYQKSSDLLIIPNSAKEDISKLYTSPMKLFGYMAGGVPILASDLPSLREILSEKFSYFFTPDDPQSLATTIDKIFKEYPKAEQKAVEALEKVRQYSWKNRAQGIINFVS
jgi:glycosyltransferase involved in cell wall biosynthesis